MALIQIGGQFPGADPSLANTSGIATMTNDTTNIAVGTCHIDVSTSRCYLPTQAASGNTFNIFGSYEV